MGRYQRVHQRKTGKVNMKATVVIPNYNGLQFIKTCLDSLREQKEKDFETLIIDNASEDGSFEYIRDFYPAVRLVQLKKNYGFSAAVNKGISMSKTKYVILLNNDTEADPDFVGELIKAIDQSDDIFSVSSKMISFHDRSRMDDAGDLYSVIGWGFQQGIGQSVENYQEDREVFSACAGAAIYRKAVFDQIGKFDLKHFAYLEDMDVGYRARIQGYRNMFCASAVVYHVGSGTSGSRYNPFKVRLAARNNLYLVYKNMPFLQLVVNMPFLALGFLIKFIFFTRMGYGKEYREGFVEGLQKCYTLKKVKFKPANLFNYVQIEKELWINTVIYGKDYLSRHPELTSFLEGRVCRK